MLLRSRWATTAAMSSQSFIFIFIFIWPIILKQFFTNFRIINLIPIINMYNKSKPTFYLFTSTIKPPRPVQHKGKIWNRGTLKGCVWEAQRDTLQLNGFTVMVSRTTKESENLPTFLLYDFTVMAAYLSSFLAVFLSSQHINTYGTWLIQLGISKPQFFLCFIILLHVFGFPFCILLLPLLWYGVDDCYGCCGF